jgi:glycosyltransferase involved in cell wall biosynthesis
VVIPTYNRRERLGRVLQALEAQSVGHAAFEVVVVDDGSTDGTADFLEQRARTFPVRVLRQSNRGPAAARNAGVADAKSRLVLFIDDDVVPCVDLIREHLLTHGDNHDLVVMGPLASLPSYRQPWVAWEQAKLEAQYGAMARGDYAPTFRQFWTGNASVFKEHILAVGGFDSAFSRGEDVELGQRLDRRGLQFRFNPRAVGLHHAERSLESWSNAHTSYGRLEVQIFGRLGEDMLLQTLADNFSRLNPLSRWLVRGCVGRTLPLGAATAVLKSSLRLSERFPGPFAKPACSVLANLLYWDASAKALGGGRIDEVFRKGKRGASSSAA